MAIAGRLKGKQPPSPLHNSEATVRNSKDRVLGDVIPVNPQQDQRGIIENEPAITNRPTRHTTVDTQYLPSANIMLYSAGTRWAVDWYRAAIGLDDQLMPLAQGTTPAHQQYVKYIDTFVNVESPLTTSQDEETKEFALTGSATVPSYMKANKSDMFVADIGDGRAGVFVVTSSEMLSDLKQAAYRIQYRMVRDYVPDDAIEQKVVRKYYFDERLVQINVNPFLTEKDYLETIQLDELDTQLRDHFIRRFWNNQINMLTIPKQRDLTHDAYHADFCMRMGLGTIKRPIQTYRNGYTKLDDTYSIWNLISDQSEYNLPECHQKYGVCATATFKGATIGRSVYWTGFKQCVYPEGDIDSVDEQYPKPHCDLIRDYTIKRDDIATPLIEPDPATLDYPHEPVTYVFSEYFYNEERERCSLIERLVLDTLYDRELSRTDVSKLALNVRKQHPITQFYCLPIILFLIDYVFKGSI